MVASGQRAGFIDEGLQPFREGIGLRGGPWRDLRFIITLRKPRRHVLRDRHRDRERAVRGRVDDHGAALADDFLNLELVQPSTCGQGAGSGRDGAVRQLLVQCIGCRLWKLHANRLGTRLGFCLVQLGSATCRAGAANSLGLNGPCFPARGLTILAKTSEPSLWRN